MNRPLCIDLFCGYGGWARGFLDAGYRVIGFDNEPKCAKRYPGEFVLADVRDLDGRRFAGARVIVASPPCTEFSKMNSIRYHGDWPADTALFQEALRIREESGVPMIIENVDGAQRFVGKAVCHRGAFYLWGDVPLLPFMRLPPKIGGSFLKERPSHKKRGWADHGRGKDAARERAMIPLALARALAEACLP